MGAPTHVAHLAILGTDPFCLFTGASGGIFPPVAGAKSECAPHFRALLGNRFFRREGGDDFFGNADRHAADPTTAAVSNDLTLGQSVDGARWPAVRRRDLCRQPTQRSSPRTDHDRSIDCIFCHWKKLNRAPTFAQSFLLPPQSGVDQTQRASGRTVVWLGLDNFLLLRARSYKRHLGLLLVVCDPSDNAFQEQTRKVNNLVLYRAFA